MEKNFLKRIARHRRIRKRIFGTDARPRMCLYRSLKNIYTQIIDDDRKVTLLSLSTLNKEVKKVCNYGGNVKAAQVLGEFLGRQAKEKGIQAVIFDRGGYKYHGRVKALAESARKSGLKF